MASPHLDSRQALFRRILDLAVLLLFSVPALQPLLTDAMTCGYDNTFHLWRSVQIEALWQQGVLYSRWAPAMAHGLGFPLYLFTSPFPPSLVALLHQSGLTWAVAMNIVFALGILLGGLGMLALARELFGRGAGWVAAIAYVYAPFQAYDVFNRGSLWEAFAWAWPPLVLWGLRRWVRLKDRRAFLVGLVAFAAMILSHHLFAFLFAPLLGLWVVWLSVQMREPRAWGRGALLGLLGLGITAFFWLPPMVERAYVQTDRLLGTWVFDYRHNFLPLSHLLALPRRADPHLINDWPQKSLGFVPALLGCVPFLFWRRIEKSRRGFVSLLLLLTLLFTMLTLNVSRFLWDRLPLLPYVQFPWRYLGPAAFCLSLLIGAGSAGITTWLREKHEFGGNAVPAMVMVGLIAANLGWFFPEHCPPPQDTSVAAMIRWEYATDTLGTTAKGEYLPVWAKDLVETPSLVDDYESGGPVVRLPAGSLPTGAVIREAVYGGLQARVRLTSPEPFTACYLALYYPGWTVFIDGRDVPVAPEPETGLLTFHVPEGTHTIAIAFRETPVRWAADAISVVSLMSFLLLTVKFPRGEAPTMMRYPSRRTTMVALAIGLGVVMLKLGFVDRQSWLWRASRWQEGGSLRGLKTPMQVNFGNRAMLLGWEGFEGPSPSGATQELTLYWRALSPGDGDWHVGLSLTDAAGASWPLVLRPARWGRTPPDFQLWPADGYARMDKLVDLPAGIPPGVYTPTLSLFDRNTLAPASVLGGDGNPVGPTLALAPIEVTRPLETPTLQALKVPSDTELQACDALGLWWVEPGRTALAPGESLSLYWVWQALAQPTGAKVAELVLEDSLQRTVQTWEVPPSAGWWPTDRWQPGDRWVGDPTLRLSGSLDSGAYVLKVQLPKCGVLAEIPLIIHAPERVWTVPESLTVSDWIFGSKIRLAGYSVPNQPVDSGASISVRLAWQALDEILTPYRVFVHLLDDTGRLIAQSDGVPVDWTRPTPGWAVGEVVVETRTLTLPDDADVGTYDLRVGLYDEDGNRLPLPDGTDAVFLSEIVVP
jgi:hypothetical protein